MPLCFFSDEKLKNSKLKTVGKLTVREWEVVVDAILLKHR